MATDDDELYRLNALHRFTKHSRLVLEAHSHCEVPAGCGGAVLQWSNPADGAPVSVRVHSGRQLDELWLDGELVKSSRTRLKPGPHLLALLLKPWGNPRVGKQPPWLMVAVTRRLPVDSERVAAACSAGDGSWRATTTDPGPAWTQAGFDDSAWLAAGASRVRPGDIIEWQRQQFTELEQQGTRALAVPDAERVWVRKAFVLPELPR